MITFPHIGYIGRLGNQMFQHSALVGIAEKHGCEYFLARKDLELYDCFDLDTKILSKYNHNFACPNNVDTSIVISGHVIYIPTEDENAKFLDTCFDLNFLNTNHDGKSILGFFQNYNYFSHVENKLREKYKFKKKYEEIASSYFSQMFFDKEVISLHIRRTDYINSHVLNNLHINYYEDGLNFFDPHLPVLVFSDDVKWCKEQKIFKDKRFYIMQSNNTYIDLCLMSKCSYHIIANSSFSWWGSWLSKSKKTICPKQWFLPYCDYLDSKGLRLPHWISI